jgi:hypothetical protein
MLDRLRGLQVEEIIMSKRSHPLITALAALTLFLVQPFGAVADTITFIDIDGPNEQIFVEGPSSRIISHIPIGINCVNVPGPPFDCAINLKPPANGALINSWEIFKDSGSVKEILTDSGGIITLFIGGPTDGAFISDQFVIDYRPLFDPNVFINFFSDDESNDGHQLSCIRLMERCDITENGLRQLAVRLFWDNGVVDDIMFQSDSVPLHDSPILLATGLAVFGLLAWRRKRKPSGALAA